jgi:hypothetical protein
MSNTYIAPILEDVISRGPKGGTELLSAALHAEFGGDFGKDINLVISNTQLIRIIPGKKIFYGIT